MANKQFNATIENQKQVEKYWNQTLPDTHRFAMSMTANDVAVEGVRKTNTIFKKKFNLSNKFLVGNKLGSGVIKFNKAIPHRDLSKISSSYGAPAKKGSSSLEFLVDQEDGFTSKTQAPTKNAYPSRNSKKVIKKNLRRANIEIMNSAGFPGKDAQQRAIFFMRQAYTNSFAMPGSKQFIYIKSGEFFNFREGMYQFANNSPKSGNQFPRLKMIYSKDDSKNKKRDATHWMEESSLSFTQKEIDTFWSKNLDKSFTNAMKKLR